MSFNWQLPAFTTLIVIASCRPVPPGSQQADSSRSDTTARNQSVGAATPAPPQVDTPATPAPPQRDRSTRDTVRHTPSPRTTAAKPAPTKPAPTTAAPTTPRPDSSSPAAGDSARQREGLGATGTPTAADTQSAAPPVRDPYHTAPLDTVDAKTYQGWKYYNLNCSRCHGEDVGGTTIAPHLIQSLKPDGTIPDEATFQTTVCGGRVEKGMPAWCQLGMTPAQIDTIYAYVKGRSDAKLHPGRPARRQ